MNKVLKLQRFGLMTPTVVEYKGKILATNQLDIDSTCRLWRIHFTIYPEEKVDLVMTEKQFSAIQQKTLSSVKSVYELFYERNFIPRVFEPTETPAEWGMYRNKEIEKLQSENAALGERLGKAVELPFGDRVWFITEDEEGAESYIISKPTDLLTVDELYEMGKKYFTTREAAESRLDELKGDSGGKNADKT